MSEPFPIPDHLHPEAEIINLDEYRNVWERWMVSCLDCGCTFKTFVHAEAPNFLDCAECGKQRCIRVTPMWYLE